MWNHLGREVTAGGWTVFPVCDGKGMEKIEPCNTFEDVLGNDAQE